MVFNISNRLYIGFLLLISIFFSYLLSLDKFLLVLIVFMVTYDFYKIKVMYSYLIILLITLTMSIYYSVNHLLQYLFIIEFLLVFFIFINNKYKKYIFTLSVYIFCLILFYINHINREYFYLIILVSFYNDTIAYLIGKNFGGPLIIPKISPNKTWSGTSISFLASTLLLLFFKINFYLSVIIAVSLFLGDIFFSYLKRHLNIKDFSMLFGDHGGVLDRLDSMFFVAIILQTYLVIFV